MVMKKLNNCMHNFTCVCSTYQVQ